MKYLKREIERKFLKMNSHFKAVLVTGARQVGKTTLAAGEDVTNTFAGTQLTTDGANATHYYYLVVTYPDTNTSQNDDQGLNIKAQITGITGAQTAVVGG